MYNGEIQISESRLAEFLKTADTLQIQGLADGAATAIPAGKGQKTSRAFGDDSAYDDEDNKYINEERLNNVEKGLGRGSDDDDIEELSRHEGELSGDRKEDGDNMKNLLRSQRLRRRQHQSRSDTLDYEDIAEEEDERPNFNYSKRRDQCQKASSVSTLQGLHIHIILNLLITDTTYILIFNVYINPSLIPWVVMVANTLHLSKQKVRLHVSNSYNCLIKNYRASHEKKLCMLLGKYNHQNNK